MSSSLSENMLFALRYVLPFFVLFLTFVLNTVSFATPLSARVDIPFVLIAVYYSAVYRPMLLSAALACLMGFGIDLLSALPLGLTSFILLIVRHIVVNQRLFLMGQPFFVIWLGFVFVCVGATVIQWLLFGLINWAWTPILPMFMGIIYGGLLFPLVSLMLNLSYRLLPTMQDQYSAVK